MLVTQQAIAKRANQTKDTKNKADIHMLDREDGVEMLGIDESDDIHKYAMVSF